VPETEFPLSTSQLNKLGDRLRRCQTRGGSQAPEDLAALNEYRAWHRPTLTDARSRITEAFHDRYAIAPEVVGVTGRPLKTTEAIIAKLVRERTRLSLMQDIAGARIIVAGPALQEPLCELLLRLFRDSDARVTKDSREEADRFGYRAVHVVVRIDGRLAEIQIRTRYQDRWAQLVEGVDSILGSDLKHGRGPAEWLEWLQRVSDEFYAADHGRPAAIPPSPLDIGIA
jgi:putative GTP pyrophosphokinase